MSRTDQIIEVVSKFRGVTVTELHSKNRQHRISHARQEAMALIYNNTRQSLPQIGRLFDLDHTTVLHGVSAVVRRMGDDSYRAEMNEMRERVRHLSRPSGLVFHSARGPDGCAFKSVRGQN